MDAHCIDYAQTGFFSQTILRYLDNDPDLKAFYNFEPTFDGIEGLIAAKQPSLNRAVLADVLLEQYKVIANGGYQVRDAVTSNIESLRLEDTYTITTGHQLNIFTGPLYFIFKIATAIKLAAQLKSKHPDKNFVPIYWMATEDHDFAEINHTYVGQRKIEWVRDAAGATGRLDTQSILATLNQYKGILGLNDNAEHLANLVNAAYTGFDKLADATRYLVNALFEQYGLVIVDADDRRLKHLFAPIIAQDIIGGHSFQNIGKTDAALQKLGVHAQVHAREINFFYLNEGIRERIVFEAGKYIVLNTDIAFTEAELKAEIENKPECFSPNVVMRPLYQEVILPNLAYIGGGAEVVYWLQLKANFDFYKVDFPVLVLRNSGLLVKKELASKFGNMGFAIADIFKDAETLKAQWVQQHSTNNLNIADEWRDIDCAFERLKLRLFKIDQTLSPSAQAIETRLKHALDNLERKMIKAEKRNFSVRLNQLDTIKADLFPGGSLQERKENFALFYVKWGQKLIDDLIEHFDPIAFEFTILTE